MLLSANIHSRACDHGSFLHTRTFNLYNAARISSPAPGGATKFLAGFMSPCYVRVRYRVQEYESATVQP